MRHPFKTVQIPNAARAIGVLAAWLLGCWPLAAAPKPLAVLKGHTQAVWHLAFSPDGKTVASAGTDGTIRLWDVPSGKERAVLKMEAASIGAIAFSPDGKTLATGSGNYGVQLWDLVTHKRLTAGQEEKDSPGDQGSVAFSPDGKTVAYSGQCANRLELWDAATGKRTVVLKSAEQIDSGPIAVAFAADGRALVSCRWEDGVELWDVVGGKRKAGAKVGKGAFPVALTRDGKLLATREDSDEERIKVRLRDAATGKKLVQFDEQCHLERFMFSRDGKALAAGDGGIVVWDVATGKDRPGNNFPF